jgi:hypothetical protein
MGFLLLPGADAYGRWHHVLTHGLVAGLLVGTLLSWWGKDRMKVWWLSLCAFHLHLLCDLLGSGTGWPIQYLWPFSDTLYGTAYGWEFDSWQNLLVAVTALVLCGRIAIRRDIHLRKPSSRGLSITQLSLRSGSGFLRRARVPSVGILASLVAPTLD